MQHFFSDLKMIFTSSNPSVLLGGLLFYIFSGVLLASALMVVVVRNPVYAVLYLIFSFLNAAALFILMDAGFIGLTILVVYVGAVAVLFLFVVMMLNLQRVTEAQKARYRFLSIIFGVMFLAEMVMVVACWTGGISSHPSGLIGLPRVILISQVQGIAGVLYSSLLYAFEGAAVALFVAMIGAIVLTLRFDERVRRQDVRKQIHEDPESVLRLVTLQSNQGMRRVTASEHAPMDDTKGDQ